MSLYETLLFLHVLAAFMLVAGIVCYGVLVLGDGGPAARPALAGPALALWNLGGLGTLVLGVWLAVDVEAYEVWDGWVLGAIVLWAIAAAAGGNLSRGVREDFEGLDPGRARLLLAAMAVATLAVLVVMIYKPGA